MLQITHDVEQIRATSVNPAIVKITIDFEFVAVILVTKGDVLEDSALIEDTRSAPVSLDRWVEPATGPSGVPASRRPLTSRHRSSRHVREPDRSRHLNRRNSSRSRRRATSTTRGLTDRVRRVKVRVVIGVVLLRTTSRGLEAALGHGNVHHLDAGVVTTKDLVELLDVELPPGHRSASRDERDDLGDKLEGDDDSRATTANLLLPRPIVGTIKGTHDPHRLVAHEELVQCKLETQVIGLIQVLPHRRWNECIRSCAVQGRWHTLHHH